MIDLHTIILDWLKENFPDVILDGLYIHIGRLCIGYITDNLILLSGPTKNQRYATENDFIILKSTDNEMFKKLSIYLRKVLRHVKACKTEWHQCNI
jgi:hypothetical protein